MPSLQPLIVLSQSGPAANALICSRASRLPDAPKAAAVGDPSLIGAGTSGPAVRRQRGHRSETEPAEDDHAIYAIRAYVAAEVASGLIAINQPAKALELLLEHQNSWQPASSTQRSRLRGSTGPSKSVVNTNLPWGCCHDTPSDVTFLHRLMLLRAYARTITDHRKSIGKE